MEPVPQRPQLAPQGGGLAVPGLRLRHRTGRSAATLPDAPGHLCPTANRPRGVEPAGRRPRPNSAAADPARPAQGQTRGPPCPPVIPPLCRELRLAQRRPVARRPAVLRQPHLHVPGRRFVGGQLLPHTAQAPPLQPLQARSPRWLPAGGSSARCVRPASGRTSRWQRVSSKVPEAVIGYCRWILLTRNWGFNGPLDTRAKLLQAAYRQPVVPSGLARSKWVKTA